MSHFSVYPTHCKRFVEQKLLEKHCSMIIFSFRFYNWLITKFKFCKMSRVIYAIVC